MLRDYQQAAVNHVLAYQGMAPLVVCPTGSGKSHIIAELVQELCRGKRDSNAMIVSHRKEILEQNAEKLLQAWSSCPLGIYSASLKSKRIDRVCIAQVQSLARRLDRIPELKCLIVDEAHLVPKSGDGQYRQLIKAARTLNPQLRVIGLTATPYRLNGGFLHKGENTLFDGIAYEIEIPPLIAQGYLCPIIGKRSDIQADLSRVGVSGGEFILSQMAQVYNDDELINKALDEIEAYGRDRNSWLLFTSSVEHAENVLTNLRRRGIRSAIVTGETMPMVRQQTLRDFKQRKIKALVNCDVLTTGFDAPCVDLIALLRATKSTALYVQILGRGMRVAAEKQNCLALDFGDNLLRHGPLDDLIIRQPSGSDKKEPGEAPFKVCPRCKSICRISALECADCGFEFEIKEVKHNAVALHGEFLTSEQVNIPQQHLISHTSFSKHTKKDSAPSMRVDYLSEHDEVISEWVCLEHEGLARSKAMRWWENRGGCMPVPDSVHEALNRVHELREVKSCYVKKDGKFNRIISVKLGGRVWENAEAVEVNTNFWEDL